MKVSSSIPMQHKKTAFAAAALFHFFHDGIADGLVAFFPLWQRDLGLSLVQVGLLMACFEGATALFQIPAGFLGERSGERFPLVAGTAVTAVGFICVGWIEGFIGLTCLLIICGCGAGVQHPLAASMVSRTYPGEGRRSAIGSYNFSGDIGKFVFPAMAAAFLTIGNWRVLTLVFGLFGCLLSLGLYVILRRFKIGEAPHHRDKSQAQCSKGWGITDRGGFTLLSILGMIDTGVRAGLVTFLPFVLIGKGEQAEAVGFALSLLFIGGAAGKLLCGMLAERLGIGLTIIVTEVITGGGILLLILLPLPAVYIFLPILGMGLNGTSSVLYGTVADFIRPEQVARAFGLFYTFLIGAAALAPPLLGTLCDTAGVDITILVTGVAALSCVPVALWLSLRMGHAKTV